jgi:hypothetical protein
MIRQLTQFNVSRSPLTGGMDLAIAGSAPRPDLRSGRVASSSTYRFPRRPDASVINETIPLFYIGQNRKGAWVVREAEGRSGGFFLFKQWAVRFARRQSEPAGCAIMFLAEPVELDIDDHDGRDGDSVSAIENVARRRPVVAGFVGAVITAWRRFAASMSRNLATQRRNRVAIEQELFGGHYTLSSKNDDDLPIVR